MLMLRNGLIVKMKKVFLLVLVFTLSLFLHLTVIKVNGTTNISMLDGASIRTFGTQGLKFAAIYDEDFLTCERGFFLIYGEASLDDLKQTLNSGEMILNCKEVLKVTSSFSPIQKISVVLTGIPISGYLDKITVFAYAYLNKEYYFSPTVVTRSIAEVAFKAGNSGDMTVSSVLNELKSNYYKVLMTEDKYEISKLYETNYLNLRDEFIKDWNNSYQLNWVELCPSSFYQEAIKIVDDKCHLYDFFANPKWEWLLTYLHDLDNDLIISNQIEEMLTSKVSSSEELIYAIVNFFNGTNYDNDVNPTLDFLHNKHYYDFVKVYNQSIYVKGDYDFVRIGEEIKLPDLKVPGYKLNYQAGDNIYPAGSQYIVNDEVSLTLNYEPIQFSISLYYESTMIDRLYYTIEDEVILPTYNLDGYDFIGWYSLSGELYEVLPIGSIGNFKLYANMQKK